MDDRASAIWLLRERLRALAGEISYWKAISRPSAPPGFRTNHSQIRAFASIVTGFIQAIRCNMRDPEFTAADARANTRNVLALYRIWEFFRVKLAQRLDARHAASLQLADEFAWACYSPTAAQVYKEPPLVFLNGGLSPFILPRNREFHAEFVPNELIEGDEFIEAMAKLPFPVIGMPWYQVATPWELPVIAHEVGHSIEGDLKLEQELRDRIERAVPDEDRRSRWKAWRSEIFADFYGCRAVGPAFASNLAEFLAGTSPAGDRAYPPTAIRMLLNFEYLKTDFSERVAGLHARWAQLLAVPQGYQKYAETDAACVAEEFRSLDVGLRFGTAHDRAAHSLAARALLPERIDGVHDVRMVVAAIRLAYETIMEKVDSRQAYLYLPRLNGLVEVLQRSSNPGIRAGGGETDAPAHKAAHLARSKNWLRV